MSYYLELYATIKSLKEAIPKSFVLNSSLANLLSVIERIVEDVKAEREWYDENKVESFKLVLILRRILRLILTRIDVSPIERPELVYLKKALVFTTLNKLREEYLGYWFSLKSHLKSSRLYIKIYGQLEVFFGDDMEFQSSLDDFNEAVQGARENFRTLQAAFPRHDVAKSAKSCEENLPAEGSNFSFPEFSLFESERFFFASFSYGEYILSLDPQSERLLSKVDLEGIKTGKYDIRGSFGHIVNTTLKYNKYHGSTDLLSMQLVEKDSICKVSNVNKARLAGELSHLIAEKHESLVNIIGYTIHWGAFCVALEPLEKTLKEYLHGSKKLKKTSLLTSDQALSVLTSLTDGLCFLHSKGLIHGDIRPENIYMPASLVFDKKNDTSHLAKLCNIAYGMNHYEPRWMAITTQESLPYCSPEVLDSERSSAASDVYSLAVCTWEMLQDNRRPYDHLFSEGRVSKSKLIRSIKSGDRPVFKQSQSGQFEEPSWATNLISKSWAQHAWDRPLSSYWKAYISTIVRQENVDLVQVNADFSSTARRHSVLSNNSHTSRPIMQEVVETFRPSHRRVPPRPQSSFTIGDVRSKISEGRGRTQSLLLDHFVKIQEGPEEEGLLPREEVEPEVKEFFSKYVPQILDNRNLYETLIGYCMKNGFEKFNEEMLKEYHHGLDRFTADSEAPSQAGESDSMKGARKHSRHNRFTTFFSIKRPKGKEKHKRSRKKKEKEKEKELSENRTLATLTRSNTVNQSSDTLVRAGSRQSIWETNLTETGSLMNIRRSVADWIDLPSLDV